MMWAEEIKNRVSIFQLFEHLGLEFSHLKAIKCPFHSEKTPSLKPYKNGKGFRCYGCGASGTVIDFAMQYWNCNISTAILRVNDELKLNLPIGENTTQHDRNNFSRSKRDSYVKNKLNNDIEKNIDNNYWLAFDEWKRLDDNSRNYAPIDKEDDFHPLFTEALQKLSYSLFVLQGASIEKYEFEHQKKKV